MNFEQNETLELARARNVHDALMEDIGRVDWTANLVPERQPVKAEVVAKESAVLCGQAWFDGCIQAHQGCAGCRPVDACDRLVGGMPDLPGRLERL